MSKVIKITSQIFLFIITFTSLFLFIPEKTFAQTATSCWVTEFGNPSDSYPLPAGCGINPIIEKAIAYARAQIPRTTYILGTPSRNWASTRQPGPNAPKNFDCSGLVGWAYYWSSGGTVKMIGHTHSDWAAARNSKKYERHFKSEGLQLQPGDIVYFKGSTGRLNPPDPGHVGLYVGPGQGTCAGKNDCFVHIFSTGKPPKEESMSTRKNSYIGFLRPVLQ